VSEAEDKTEIEQAQAVLKLARERLASALEEYESARERGLYTTLPDLRAKLERAWQVKVDAHLVFLETSLSSTIRRLTEYVRYMNEVTKMVGGGQIRS
jgi:hypothetical protein